MDDMKDHVHIGDRSEHNKQTLNRIRRLKGQLDSLERMIEADEGTCEDRVIRARTIEKGVTSLIRNLVSCYMDNTARHEMVDDPDKVVADMTRIIELLNK
ncbi:metal-sensing transcriptional repressor [Phototrophicus methaneseepsis]|uniref:Metal-sensing transcriptional repressor n=1 Tax=Phototrophicus methaneseepsis TaxID=2710758 RepID=A0A7S8E7L7_9CHLR|nr:metal-sensing transcriptional repressor [Phototrophicus methaneseepsis]QPC81834.1 metal-sensing transcriptional repressor [Phototrophicus methaneseepsis]